jgi:hypothetical protein
VASVATRQEKNLVQRKNKRTDLTPTGLLMEHSETKVTWSVPLEMATTGEGPFVRLLTLSRDAGHTTNTIFEPNLRQLLAKEVTYGWRHRFC